MTLTNIKLGAATAPGAPFTENRFVDCGVFKFVLNGTAGSILELTNGVNRKFAFNSGGQLTMDTYGIGAFTGTETKWLAVTAAGLVIEKTPPTSFPGITADNALTASSSTNVQLGSSSSTGQALLHHTFIYGASTYTLNYNAIRVEEAKGTNVTAANNLTLGLDGNLFTITGNTQINAITTADWQAGSEVDFVFTGTPTLKHNTAGGAGTATMLLAGSVDYIAAAADTIKFVYDGTNWHEISRKIAATGVVTADYGLSMEGPANNVRLGTSNTNGNLASFGSHRYINTGTFTLVLKSISAGNPLLVQTGANTGIAVTSTTVAAITTSTTSGEGAIFFSNSGVGILARSQSGYGGRIQVIPATDVTTIIPILSIARAQSVTPAGSYANGMGLSMDFSMPDDNNAGRISHEFKSIWTIAADATRTSQMIITGVNSATTVDLIKFNGDNSWQITPITATAASTITPAEGMMLFVSSTDATFTTKGFWGYANGAWAAF